MRIKRKLRDAYANWHPSLAAAFVSGLRNPTKHFFSLREAFRAGLQISFPSRSPNQLSEPVSKSAFRAGLAQIGLQKDRKSSHPDLLRRFAKIVSNPS